ncbi:MAG TPA: J domain-containing protein [bacterium]|nr:J domain-containing protein [bacterium]
MNAKNYYNILGVGEKADTNEIKKTYRNLAKQYHPDKHPGDRKAEEKFKELSEAYSVLSDPAKRQKYDQMRKYGTGPGGGGFDFGNFDFGPFRHTGRTAGPGGFTFEGFEFGGGLGDILSEIFGIKSERRAGRTDNILTAEVQVPSEIATRGGKVQFTLLKEDVCPSCNGGGARPGSRIDACPVCRGTGRASAGGFLGPAGICTQCRGKGKIIHNPCDRCGGSGVANRRKTYAVRIPPGTKEGELIRLRGQGKPASEGRPAGDLMVTVRIQQDRFFRFSGDDAYCEVPISLKQAYRGTQMRVRTPKGVKVKVTVPPGTRDGTQFRLAGMGARKNGRAGDQFVTVRVKRPDNPDAEERDMIDTVFKSK